MDREIDVRVYDNKFGELKIETKVEALPVEVVEKILNTVLIKTKEEYPIVKRQLLTWQIISYTIAILAGAILILERM